MVWSRPQQQGVEIVDFRDASDDATNEQLDNAISRIAQRAMAGDETQARVSIWETEQKEYRVVVLWRMFQRGTDRITLSFSIDAQVEEWNQALSLMGEHEKTMAKYGLVLFSILHETNPNKSTFYGPIKSSKWVSDTLLNDPRITGSRL